MFSERLEYGKYDFQHLQGTVRVEKPVQFRGFSAKSTVFAVMPFEDFFLCVSRLSKIFFSKKKKSKNKFFGQSGRLTLPRFKIWTQSEHSNYPNHLKNRPTLSGPKWSFSGRAPAEPITCVCQKIIYSSASHSSGRRDLRGRSSPSRTLFSQALYHGSVRSSDQWSAGPGDNIPLGLDPAPLNHGVYFSVKLIGYLMLDYLAKVYR